MIYKPSKKELDRIKALNRAYKLLTQAFKLIVNNVPKEDNELSVYIYRFAQALDGITRRIAKILESERINSQFMDIMKSFKDTK